MHVRLSKQMHQLGSVMKTRWRVLLKARPTSHFAYSPIVKPQSENFNFLGLVALSLRENVQDMGVSRGLNVFTYISLFIPTARSMMPVSDQVGHFKGDERGRKAHSFTFSPFIFPDIS